MWPATPMQRLASVVVLLVIAHAVLSRLTLPTPSTSPSPANSAPTEQLEVGAPRTLETGHGARLRIAGVTGSISVKTGRPQEVLIERRSQAAPGQLEGPSPTPLGLQHEGRAISVGRPLREAGAFGIMPGSKFEPVAADLRITVADDAALELLDINGKVTVTAVQGGVILRGGTVSADFTNLGSRGLSVEITGGRVSVDGVGGTCNLSLGDAPLTATQLSCQELAVSSRKSVHIEDGNALGRVSVTTTAGSVTAARIRADEVTAVADRGGIEMTDATIDGKLSLRTSTGDVTLTRLGADELSLVAEAGAVELSDVRGQLDITARQGAATLRRVTSDALKVAAGGAVVLSGALEESTGHEIRSGGGGVSVYLPKEASLALNADAGNGTITVDPAFQVPSGRQQLRTDIHGGDVPLTIVSGGGPIRLLTGQPMF